MGFGRIAACGAHEAGLRLSTRKAHSAYPKSHPVKQKAVARQKTWPLVQHSPDRWNKNGDGPTRRR